MHELIPKAVVVGGKGGEGGGEGCEAPAVRANSRDAQPPVFTGLNTDGRMPRLASHDACDGIVDTAGASWKESRLGFRAFYLE